jgi:hypothetical protein
MGRLSATRDPVNNTDPATKTYTDTVSGSGTIVESANGTFDFSVNDGYPSNAWATRTDVNAVHWSAHMVGSLVTLTIAGTLAATTQSGSPNSMLQTATGAYSFYLPDSPVYVPVLIVMDDTGEQYPCVCVVGTDGSLQISGLNGARFQHKAGGTPPVVVGWLGDIVIRYICSHLS